MVRLLCEYGASVDLNSSGHARTALHYAAISGSVDCVRSLVVDYNASVGRVDGEQHSPLFYAAALGHFGVVRLLVEECEVNLVPEHGADSSSPLFIPAPLPTSAPLLADSLALRSMPVTLSLFT